MVDLSPLGVQPPGFDPRQSEMPDEGVIAVFL
jgi:hypothetical protein